PTTYVILEALAKKGLVSKATGPDAKKMLFQAEPPERLERYIERQRQDIDQRERDLKRLIPELKSAYAFGEETAATLGVDTERTTTAVLVVTALLAGAAVALAGLVAFVGLVVPHAVRGVIGARHRPLVGASFLAGAALLVLADLGARTVLAPAELPVGVITGAVGGPFFLLLLVRSRRIVA
ncbi:MAG: iron chelate uptake ABC transporter family permease subunit, partial [Chloroflexota bacterium]